MTSESGRVKISRRQVELMVELIEKDPRLIQTKFTTTFTKKHRDELWKVKSEFLNAEFGAKKTMEKWQRAWADVKRSARKRAMEVKQAATKPGGGVLPLSQYEERVIALIGEDGVTDDVEILEFDDVVIKKEVPEEVSEPPVQTSSMPVSALTEGALTLQPTILAASHPDAQGAILFALTTGLPQPSYSPNAPQAAYVPQTSQAPHMQPTSQAPDMQPTSQSPHMQPTSQASHPQQTSQASHTQQTSQTSHTQQTSQAPHAQQTSDGEPPSKKRVRDIIVPGLIARKLINVQHKSATALEGIAQALRVRNTIEERRLALRERRIEVEEERNILLERLLNAFIHRSSQ